MLEFWKRKEVTYVMMWGMSGFEQAEADRSEFQGVDIPSPVDGEDMRYFPARDYATAVAKTSATVAGLVVVLMGVYASIFALSTLLNFDPDVNTPLLNVGLNLAQLIPHMLCAGVVLAGGSVLPGIAERLTDMENYRTATE